MGMFCLRSIDIAAYPHILSSFAAEQGVKSAFCTSAGLASPLTVHLWELASPSFLCSVGMHHGRGSGAEDGGV